MTITANVTIRRPRMEDGANIWRLVKQSGVLDVNSSYCYLMMCKMFPDTCAVAEMDGRLVGFVIAFRPPVEPDSLFIWQIGVDPALRGNGLGKALIQTLLERPTVGNDSLYYRYNLTIQSGFTKVVDQFGPPI